MIKDKFLKNVVLLMGYGMMSSISLGAYAEEGTSRYSFEVFSEQIQEPRGLSVAPDGSIWVANSRDVIHYDVNGQVISKIGNADREVETHNITGEFSLARGIVATKDGSVWVTDGINYFRGGMGTSYSRIQQFNNEGSILNVIDLPCCYAPFEGDGFDIAISENGSLWVADAFNHKIAHFGSNGEIIYQSGELEGVHKAVSGIEVAADGSIWIAQGYDDRLQHINTDGSIIKIIGNEGTDAGQFQWPHGMAIAPDGSLWVADTGNHRIQHFTAEGDFIEQMGTLGSLLGQFNLPFDIAVGTDGVIWVADSTNNRIQKITPLGTAQDTLAVEYNDKKEQVIFHDVVANNVHYQAVLQYQNGHYVLKSSSMTNKHFDSPAIFDNKANLLSVPSASVFNTEYQASFKHLGNFVFELISATQKNIR